MFKDSDYDELRADARLAFEQGMPFVFKAHCCSNILSGMYGYKVCRTENDIEHAIKQANKLFEQYPNQHHQVARILDYEAQPTCLTFHSTVKGD